MDRPLPWTGSVIPDHHDSQRIVFRTACQFFCRTFGYLFIFIGKAASHSHPDLSQPGMTERLA